MINKLNRKFLLNPSSVVNKDNKIYSLITHRRRFKQTLHKTNFKTKLKLNIQFEIIKQKIKNHNTNQNQIIKIKKKIILPINKEL